MTFKDCVNLEKQAIKLSKNLGTAIEIAKAQGDKHSCIRMGLDTAEELYDVLVMASEYFGWKLENTEVPHGRNKKRSVRKRK